jgi:hypothetical protein
VMGAPGCTGTPGLSQNSLICGPILFSSLTVAEIFPQTLNPDWMHLGTEVVHPPRVSAPG